MTDRTEKFMARVRSMLAGLDEDADVEQLLVKLREGWERRYAFFVLTGGQSEPVDNPADPPMASDYLLTINALAAELERVRATA